MSESSLKVLLVEDDENDVIFLRRAVSRLRLPWALEVARDGEEALERLNCETAPTHVILDIKIPRRTGLELLAFLRGDSSKRGTRVIILTSSKEKSDLSAAAGLGFDRYLTKPVAFTDFIALVEDMARAWGFPPDGP